MAALFEVEHIRNSAQEANFCKGWCVSLAPLLLAASFAALTFTAQAAPGDGGAVDLLGVVNGVLRSDNITTRLQDENVNAAQARVKEAAGAFDWNVSAGGGWQRFYVPRAVNGVLTNQTDVIGSYYYTASIGRQFRNGIQINPGITAYPGGASAAQTLGVTRVRPSLGIKIPLMRSLGTEATDSTEQSAQESAEAARFTRDYTIEQEIVAATQTYWKCLGADKMAQIALQSDKEGGEFASRQQELAKKGFLEPGVARQLESNNVIRHVNAEQSQQAVQICRRDLGLAVTGLATGASMTPGGDLLDPAAVKAQIDKLNPDRLIDIALANRKDLKAAQQNVIAASAALKGAEDNVSPALDVHIDPDRAIMTYSQSIENNAGHGHAAEAASAQSQAQLAFAQLQNQIQVDVSDALRSLRQNCSDGIALGTSELQMQDAVSNAQKRAKFGTSAWNDVLTAQDQLTQIRNQNITARVQLGVNLAALKLTTGTLNADRETPAAIAKSLSSPAID